MRNVIFDLETSKTPARDPSFTIQSSAGEGETKDVIDSLSHGLYRNDGLRNRTVKAQGYDLFASGLASHSNRNKEEG